MRIKYQFILSIAFILLSFPVLFAQNIALNKPTSQSSNFGSFSASRATDGNLTNFTHTNINVSPHWLRVDLGAVYTVDRIVIRNRTSTCCRDRINGAIVFAGNAESSNPIDYTEVFTLNSDLVQEKNGLSVEGRYIMVYLATGVALSLAEIEVFGTEGSTGGSSGGGTTGGGTSGESVWDTSSNNDISYEAGDVAIGRAIVPNGYKLAVEGKIITEEVRVELSGSWPDYVFTNDYRLPSIEEVERHIKEKGHLINIPSAKEVEANGIELGEMNKLLLEKIEEQMLYILQLEKRMKEVEKKVNCNTN